MVDLLCSPRHVYLFCNDFQFFYEGPLLTSGLRDVLNPLYALVEFAVPVITNYTFAFYLQHIKHNREHFLPPIDIFTHLRLLENIGACSTTNRHLYDSSVGALFLCIPLSTSLHHADGNRGRLADGICRCGIRPA